MQEAGIAFIGFGDQVRLVPSWALIARCIQTATDHERRVRPPAANTEAIRLVVVVLPWVPATATMAIAHQLGQHFGARHHGNTALEGVRFRVGGIHGARHHQHIGIGGVFGAVADKDRAPNDSGRSVTGDFQVEPDTW